MVGDSLFYTGAGAPAYSHLLPMEAFWLQPALSADPKWAQLSDTATERLHAVYTGDKSMKTSNGDVIAWKDLASFIG